jgi:ammonia channel protein AmtB
MAQIMKQLISIGFTAAFACLMTLVILFVLKAVMGDLRPSEEDESQGLDLSEHSESAYGHPS